MKLDSERYRRLTIMRASFLLRRILRRPTVDPALYSDHALTIEEHATLQSCVKSVQREFPDRALLFIYGIMPRSGTNVLYELLLRNQAFAAPRIPFSELPVLAGETYFSAPTEFIGRVHAPSARAFSRMEWMAYALAGFRNRLLDLAPPGSITLVKCPLLWGIDLAPVFFPNDQALILQRNAKYICDSFHRSFARRRLSRTFEDICIETALSIDKFFRFKKVMRADRFNVVKYEEAMTNKLATMSQIGDWLDGPGEISFSSQECCDVPVYGSSVYSPRTAEGLVDWGPVQPPTDFDPINRLLNWSSAQERTFERICGPLNRKMGYD